MVVLETIFFCLHSVITLRVTIHMQVTFTNPGLTKCVSLSTVVSKVRSIRKNVMRQGCDFPSIKICLIQKYEESMGSSAIILRQSEQKFPF
jgi:hypothetical protein